MTRAPLDPETQELIAAARALSKAWKFGLANRHIGNELRRVCEAVRPFALSDEHQAISEKANQVHYDLERWRLMALAFGWAIAVLTACLVFALLWRF